MRLQLPLTLSDRTFARRANWREQKFSRTANGEAAESVGQASFPVDEARAFAARATVVFRGWREQVCIDGGQGGPPVYIFFRPRLPRDFHLPVQSVVVGR